MSDHRPPGTPADDDQRTHLPTDPPGGSRPREDADAKAYGLAAMMRSFAGADPKVLQALATAGMDPAQLMALAFRDLADNAAKIGQLNVTPDLLREIMQPGAGA